jgi:hypothetical protein
MASTKILMEKSSGERLLWRKGAANLTTDTGEWNWLSIVLVLAQLNYHGANKNAQRTSNITQRTVELGYNVTKGTEYFVSL